MPKTYSSQRNLSWPDYLKVNEIAGVGDEVRQVRYEVSSSNRKLIATYAELQREHIEATRSISDAVSSGFEQLSFDMQAISGGIAELTAVFEWGFSELLTGVGHINDSLQALLQIAKTPAQTWAYEQFEIARDGFRKGLYEEALEYLNRSIEGHGDNTGYKIEYRFHFLLGTIRLGSFQNNSPSIVDLGEAEKAFLAAAKYARHDQPKEAGRSFLAAGWVAYLQDKIPEAEKLTEQAISLYPELGEAYYQLAKILMHRGDPENALLPLRKAIELDRNYTIKASSDDDFRVYDKQVSGLIEQMHKEAREKSTNALVVLEKEAAELEKSHVEEFSPSTHADLKPLMNSIDRAKKSVGNNTYFGYLDALPYCRQAKEILSKTRQAFLKSALSDVRSKVSNIDNEIRANKDSGMRATWGRLVTIGIGISFVLSVYQCSNTVDANKRQAQISQQAFDRIHNEREAITTAMYRAHGMTAEVYDRIQNERRAQRDQQDRMYDAQNAYGTWFVYFFVGTMISVILAKIADGAQKSSEVSNFKREQSRLRKIEVELEELQKTA
jgi:tetratricopeptide (TPR) repeat protein